MHDDARARALLSHRRHLSWTRLAAAPSAMAKLTPMMSGSKAAAPVELAEV